MSPRLLYRIAAVLFLLFALGHTVGFLSFKSPTPEAATVREAMDRVHFHATGGTFSYGGFYAGFGLYVTAYLLFSAFLAWHLGGLAARDPAAIGGLGWALCAVQVASLALCWFYFSAAPTVLSALLAICLGWAALLVK